MALLPGRPITRVAGLAELVRETPGADFAQAALRGPSACTLEPAALVRFGNYFPANVPPFQGKSRRRFMEPLQYEAGPVRLYALEKVRFFGSSGPT